MLNIIQSIDEKTIAKLETFTAEDKGIWINAIAPTPAETQYLSETLNIEELAFQYPLDENETARIEQEEDYVLLILNYPVIDEHGYDTRALGIILTDRAIVTVAKEPLGLLDQFAAGQVKTFGTHKKGRFVFQLFYKITNLFLMHLNQMGKKLDTAEAQLARTTKNEELIKLLGMNNGLTYFSTSLRGNQTLLQKISRSDPFRIYEEDRELLEDTIIENNQALEMTKTYINILSSTMDAFASIINNNLNEVMKFMTAWTIVIMVPTFIVSMYGMNVKLPIQDNPLAFIAIVLACITLTISLIIFFIRRRFF